MYRNRGNLSNTNQRDGYRAPHYSNYWNGRFIIVKYDKSFVAIQLVALLIVAITAFAVYLYSYKVLFYDPIASVKSTYLTAQIICLIISVALTGFATFFSKSKENLIANLRIIATLSILMVIILFVVKFDMNNKYNEKTFSEFYDTYESPNYSEKSIKDISIRLSGMKILNTEEDYKQIYIEDSINAYMNFKIKTMIFLIAHILLIILMFYLSHRLSYIEEKKQQLSKNDEILYDEEENVKY